MWQHSYERKRLIPIVEALPQEPINPYGQTKLDVENCLKSFAHAYGLSFAAFRYFNAAGAAEDGTLGEDHQPETHLIPLVIDAATGPAIISKYSARITIRLMALVCAITCMWTIFRVRTLPLLKS